MRKGHVGMAAVLAVLSFAGPALGGVALPVKKPRTQTAVQVVLPAFKPLASLSPSPAALPVPKPVAQDFSAHENSFIGGLFDRLSGKQRLAQEDAARYARVFTLQQGGDWSGADAQIAALQDGRLLGHVLYQRYMSEGYTASWAELSGWLRHYADHPGAQKLHALALRRKPAGAGAPPAPQKAGRGLPAGYHDADVGQPSRPWLEERKFTGRKRDIARDIDRLLSDSPTAALKRLETEEARNLFSPTSRDALQALIAQSYFFNGKYDRAYALAAKSADSSPRDVPLAGWIAGLSAWRAGDYAASARYFSQAATSPRASAWMAAAGGYWTARAHLRAREPRQVRRWLAHAAAYPRTFYGIIALKALGMEQARFNWDVPTLNEKRVQALAQQPAGWRALALADAGQAELAGQELRQIAPGDDKMLREAMVALAAHAGAPDLSLRIGNAFTDGADGLYDAALYPDAPWEPSAGYKVDRALVYAFIRQESKFDAGATNRSSGATGLMQLMPATARHVARQTGGGKIDAEDLRDPAVNIALGQAYLDSLLQDARVEGNLFKLAVAYNAGPGKLARWEKQVRYEDDPLLFIESIPVAETRMFVERVMANFWIYRLKYGQDTESLDRVAEGEWPVYTAQDIRRRHTLAEAVTVMMR